MDCGLSVNMMSSGWNSDWTRLIWLAWLIWLDLTDLIGLDWKAEKTGVLSGMCSSLFWLWLAEALLVQKEAQEAKATATEGFLLLYANLLSKDAQFHWDKIVSSQVGAAPWT